MVQNKEIIDEMDTPKKKTIPLFLCFISVIFNLLFSHFVSGKALIWINIMFGVYTFRSNKIILIPLFVFLVFIVMVNVLTFLLYFKKHLKDKAKILFVIDLLIALTPYFVYFITDFYAVIF